MAIKKEIAEALGKSSRLLFLESIFEDYCILFARILSYAKDRLCCIIKEVITDKDYVWESVQMKKRNGYPLPLGISEKEDYTNFSVAVPSGKECVLKLYKQGKEDCTAQIVLSEDDGVGEVRCISLPTSSVKNMEYNYEIDGKPQVDAYAKSVVEFDGKHIRGRVFIQEYDWEDDKPLKIPYHEVVAYNLHLKGFTNHPNSKVKKKGTFQGIVEKIPYLQELGINQIQCMPIYSFEENTAYKNYWGYGEAFCFAVKNRYAAGKNAENELKDMVKVCHKAGIEVVLNLPFTAETSKQLIVECLRYYVMEYHIDGFVLNPYIAPMDNILSDPILKQTKILTYNDDFQNVMRRFLKGDEGLVDEVMRKLKQQTKEVGSCNYITNHIGFTLQDLVSYGVKHNEDNGEDNNDGPNYNHSWNCGEEGPTRKKAVNELRKKQVRNAFFLLLSAQGTPCILAGDEFGNSQNGNNNVYCQDNEIAWLDWNDLKKNQELFQYVKDLIALRKELEFLHPMQELKGLQETRYGMPQISYHGEQAWKAPTRIDSRQLGVYYHWEKEEAVDCFVAYNMHWEKKNFALPPLQRGKKWYQIFTTEEAAVSRTEVLVENQREINIAGRTIVMFVGR